MQHHPRILDRQIADLTQIPGVGPVTAATLAACFASHAFAHPDQFVAYLGLDVRDSGQRSGQRMLSKRGDPELRRLFCLGAQANRRSRDPDNPFKQQNGRNGTRV